MINTFCVRVEGRSGQFSGANRDGVVFEDQRRHLRQTQQSPASQPQGSVGFDAR